MDLVFKTFVHQRALSTEEKGNSQNGRKYLQAMLSAKGLTSRMIYKTQQQKTTQFKNGQRGLMPVIPALWEAKARGSLEAESSRSAWATQ